MLDSIAMTNAERVYSEIQKLSDDERLKLDHLLGIVSDPEAEVAWMAETLRRRAERKAGRVEALPVEEALEQMFAKP